MRCQQKREGVDRIWRAAILELVRQDRIGYSRTRVGGISQGWLKNTEENWLALEDRNVLLDEPRNNGSWIRPWGQAVNRFKNPNL